MKWIFHYISNEPKFCSSQSDYDPEYAEIAFLLKNIFILLRICVHRIPNRIFTIVYFVSLGSLMKSKRKIINVDKNIKAQQDRESKNRLGMFFNSMKETTLVESLTWSTTIYVLRTTQAEIRLMMIRENL